MDYYGVLGVAQNASLKEIKEAYRKQALKHHPDRFCNATKAEQEQASIRFKAAAEAYKVLSNEANRTTYDLSGRQRSWSDAGSASANRNNKYHTAYNPYESYGTASGAYGHRKNRRAWKNHGFSSWSEFSYRYGRQMTFHTVASVALLGILFLTSSSADWIWNSVNQGRSFEEFVAAREKRLQSQRGTTTTTPNQGTKIGEQTPQGCAKVEGFQASVYPSTEEDPQKPEKEDFKAGNLANDVGAAGEEGCVEHS